MTINTGDIPCVNLYKENHILLHENECLCGLKYRNGKPDRTGIIPQLANVIFSTIADVTCDKCKNLFLQMELKEFELILTIGDSIGTFIKKEEKTIIAVSKDQAIIRLSQDTSERFKGNVDLNYWISEKKKFNR